MTRPAISYLERRAREEATKAANAAHPVRASAHRLLAIQYEDELRDRGEAQPA